ncbi:MAG: hypothetical protein ABSG22_05060 [Sedimentisphaerales bacterium]
MGECTIKPVVSTVKGLILSKVEGLEMTPYDMFHNASGLSHISGIIPHHP